MDPEEKMKDFLFRNKDYPEVRKVIMDIWVLRNRRLKDLERIVLTGEKDKGKDKLTSGDLSHNRTTESQDRDPSTTDPLKDNLPNSRLGDMKYRDIPRAQHLQGEEVNMLQERQIHRNIENQSQSDPPRNGIQQGGSGNLLQNSLPKRKTALQNILKTW